MRQCYVWGGRGVRGVARQHTGCLFRPHRNGDSSIQHQKHVMCSCGSAYLVARSLTALGRSLASCAALKLSIPVHAVLTMAPPLTPVEQDKIMAARASGKSTTEIYDTIARGRLRPGGRAGERAPNTGFRQCATMHARKNIGFQRCTLDARSMHATMHATMHARKFSGF